MVRKYVIFSFIISLFIFLAFPKTSTAEIATTKDWLGLFPANGGYDKTDTIQNCTSLDSTNKRCWFYTSTCSQTAPLANAVPKLADSSSCVQFTLSPTLSPNCKPYVFRLMANDGTTSEDLISWKTVSFGSGCSTAIINGKLFHILGNLTINSDIPVNETGVIFVDGNLYINTNLFAYPSGKTAADPKKGIVFIVKGTIYINRDITTVNAFLISHGKDASNGNITPFCSAYNTATGVCGDYTDAEHLVNSALRKQLTINGSVISLNPTLEPSFVRKYAIPANTAPAEIVNYDPKYLAIMKDVFSRDLKIWREIQ